ncbi:MAG TPA: carboxypeptidase regulatory-like domain-containing protein [Bryobacteraceae bacterium]|jgi:hypothetical protein
MNDVPLVIRGAVVMQNADPTKELPVGQAEITLVGVASASTKSDDTGFFRLLLPPVTRPKQALVLHFEHPDYESLDLRVAADNRLYVAHLLAVERPMPPDHHGPQVKISNMVVRYSVNTINAVNVGSKTNTFEVVNKGNVPCNGQRPCSPDGQWKAALGTAVMDAGAGNEFHNARASCIAGPCAFTRIEENNFARDSQILKVSVLNWSDTTTFLLEAEVFHPTVGSLIRQSYPLIFERALTFTLPGSAEGVSIEAQMNDSPIVFPLGPALILSWATCQEVVNKDGSRVYRCELKPEYRFS